MFTSALHTVVCNVPTVCVTSKYLYLPTLYVDESKRTILRIVCGVSIKLTCTRKRLLSTHVNMLAAGHPVYLKGLSNEMDGGPRLFK